MISPVVAGNQSENIATQALAVGTGSEVSQPIGARRCHIGPNSSKPGIPLAAVVYNGPAAIKN